jgi:hypothetical protein
MIFSQPYGGAPAAFEAGVFAVLSIGPITGEFFLTSHSSHSQLLRLIPPSDSILSGLSPNGTDYIDRGGFFRWYWHHLDSPDLRRNDSAN